MNDQLDLDDIDLDDVTANRLRRYFDITSHHVHLPYGDPAAVRALAYRRTVRRRRAVTGTVAAATVGSLIVGLQQLSTVPPDEDAAAQTPAPPADGSPDVADATLTDSPFVWKVEDPGQGSSILSAYGAGSSFSGLAVSTAPGGAVDVDQPTADDNAPVVWRSDDGISWEQTSLESPFDQSLYHTVSAGGALYAVATAPGATAAEPNSLQLAVARADSDDWTMVDLGAVAGDVGEYPHLQVSLEESVAALDDGSALVAVTPSRSVADLGSLLADAGVDPDSIPVASDDGVAVVDAACPDSATASTIVLPDGPVTIAGPEPSHDASTATTTTTATASTISPRVDGCETTDFTWAELGLPAESIAALGDGATEFYRVTPDGNIEGVASPVPGTSLYSIYAEGVPVYWTGEQGQSTGAYRFDGAEWQSVSHVPMNWTSSPARVGATTMGWAHLDGRGNVFAQAPDAGGVAYSDPSVLFSEHSVVSANWGAVAGDVYVSGVSVLDDSIAAQGGVVVAERGPVTIRQDSILDGWYYADAATGERIPDAQIDYTDDGVSIRDAAGEELARFSAREIEEEFYVGLVVEPSPTWSIVTTVDGTAFSIESVADLLGTEEGEIRSIGRVDSDGTQVVVVVTLTETYDDGTPKMLTLVGTPRG